MAYPSPKCGEWSSRPEIPGRRSLRVVLHERSELETGTGEDAGQQRWAILHPFQAARPAARSPARAAPREWSRGQFARALPLALNGPLMGQRAAVGNGRVLSAVRSAAAAAGDMASVRGHRLSADQRLRPKLLI